MRCGGVVLISRGSESRFTSVFRRKYPSRAMGNNLYTRNEGSVLIQVIFCFVFCLCFFNKTYNINLSIDDLIGLLNFATKNQLFQFNGNLYEQVDGVAMGSPLGPLMANAFMCSVEEKLAHENKLPSFYNRYVDDTLALVRDLSDATDLLACLNEAHPSIQFTMEIATNDRLPFIGMEIIKIDGSLETCVYRKKTNKGLLLHYQSHVDSRYKRSLLRTMLDRAKRLSSTQDFLSQECKNLKEIFLKLKYPEKLINSAINRLQHPKDPVQTPSDSPSGLRCHLKIRNRLTWFADNLAIWEQKLTNNYSRSSQAKRLLIT